MKKNIYIHEVAGRIRVRTAALKNNERAATALQTLLTALPGVTASRANPVTGSVIVTYDTGRITSAAILDLFRAKGYLELEAKVSGHAVERGSFGQLVDAAAPKIGKVILGWTLERAVSAAAAALL